MTATRRRQTGAGAFTLTELLVVMGSIVMLAAVLLSVAFTTQERVLRAQCTDNLRQIGVGWNMYQQEFNQVMPCHWKGVTYDSVVPLPILGILSGIPGYFWDSSD